MRNVKNRVMNNDDSVDFLNEFVAQFEEMIRHEGYGDIHVSVRNRNSGEKEVVLHCGKEYRYLIDAVPYRRKADKGRRLFKVIKPGSVVNTSQGIARPAEDRRKQDRRKTKGPWNFRLERRMGADRRQRRDRRGR